MVAEGDGAAPEQADAERTRTFRTGEWPIVKIDLSEAYAAVRQRGRALRRRRIISGVLAAVVMTTLFSVLGVYYVSTIPLPDALSLPATTTVYYADGTTVMARLGSQNRSLVNIDALPRYVGEAVVAAEDPAFWLDSATLISRQYARAATGVNDGTPSGQARLLVMSWKLEDSYDKNEILEFYLNTVYFGRGAYGIEAAARAYFHKPATELTLPEAVVLAGVIESPGDGRFDPTLDRASAQARFAAVTDRMVLVGSLDRSTADALRVPLVAGYDITLFHSGLDRPTGLVVAQVLAELRRSTTFRDTPAHFVEEGGFDIVTTIDARAQALLEQTADETVRGSLMNGQPDNLQASAAVVEPGTGRVIAYYGGHDGTGADYAGVYNTADGTAAGFGAHPPGQTFAVYALAAALDQGISVQSRWDSPESKEFPASGRTGNPVIDPIPAGCQPACTLAEAAASSLNVPYFAVTERVGPARVIDLAHAAGVTAMWVPESPGVQRQRYELAEASGAQLTPRPFGPEVGLGDYPVTVLDQATGMATFAAGGLATPARFVREVSKAGTTVYRESTASPTRVLDPAEAADLTWVLSQHPAGALPDGRPSAAWTGVGRLRTSTVETAHAWTVGYTTNLAMAVWIGNEADEFPLKDREGARVTGTGLPAEIYRAFMAAAHARLDLPARAFAAPAFTGDDQVGDAAEAE